jgi:hypothetical protein
MSSWWLRETCEVEVKPVLLKEGLEVFYGNIFKREAFLLL